MSDTILRLLWEAGLGAGRNAASHSEQRIGEVLSFVRGQHPMIVAPGMAKAQTHESLE